MTAIFRPISFSTSDSARASKQQGIIKKGGSLRHHAATPEYSPFDDKTAAALKALRAELNIMRDQDEEFSKRLKLMDVALEELNKSCYTPSPATPQGTDYFFDIHQHQQHDVATPTMDSREDSPNQLALDESNGLSPADNRQSRDAQFASSVSTASAVSEMSTNAVSPPLMSGDSLCDMDSVFGSPVARPFWPTANESGSDLSDMLPPFSPPIRSHHMTPQSSSIAASSGTPYNGPAEDVLTPLVHSDVANLHRPLENSASFGEASFMNNLKDNSLLGDDLIAMFNQKSDAVKKEFGMSETSLASNPPGSSSSPTGNGRMSGSPQPPRAASCADFRSSTRPESPLVRGDGNGGGGGNGGTGRVRRGSGSNALGMAMSYLYSSSNNDVTRARPSPSQSPVSNNSIPSGPLNMKALLGQSSPSGPRVSPDTQYTSSSTPTNYHRFMLSRSSTGGLQSVKKERLCRKPAHMAGDDHQRSNSFSQAAVGPRTGQEWGPSDAERDDMLSPLRRGSRGWHAGMQEEQFLRGRLVTSPPGMTKKPPAGLSANDAAGHTGMDVTPTICSQKHHHYAFDLTATMIVHVEGTLKTNVSPDQEKYQPGGQTELPERPSSAVEEDPNKDSTADRRDSNLSQLSNLSHSSSSLSSRKSRTSVSSVSKFFGTLVRGQKKSK